jgi:phosphoglycerate dehydrogenase-like enzyme
MKGSVPAAGSRLSVVARFGVGFDSVDVDACTAAGIAVTITPDGVGCGCMQLLLLCRLLSFMWSFP